MKRTCFNVIGVLQIFTCDDDDNDLKIAFNTLNCRHFRTFLSNAWFRIGHFSH